MSRPPRIQFEGATYHIFSRGNRKELIFRREADYEAFESILLETAHKSRVELFNWSQLPNHFHFNVETPNGNIAEFMQRMVGRYAIYFNRVHQFVGHVFQGRYGARLVDHDTYFQEIVRYVELNPYRLKKGRLADFGKWRWSSWFHYRRPPSEWPPAAAGAFRRLLHRFGDDVTSGFQNLSKFLADGLAEGNWEDFYSEAQGPVLGDEDFMAKVLERSGRSEPSLSNIRTGTGLNDLVLQWQTASGLHRQVLRTHTKKRQVSRWQQAFAWVARRMCRWPVTQIGEAINRRNSAVSMMIGRYEKSAGRPEADQLLRLLTGPSIPKSE